MTIWEEIVHEESIVSRNSISTPQVESYAGEIVGSNDNEIPESLVSLNNKFKWIPTKLIKVTESGIQIPNYIYNQYFK